MTETEELRLRKLVESIGASSLYMQWARFYLQRTSDYMRENLNPGIDDLVNEDRIGRSFNPLVVEDSLEEMDRTLYTAWRAMLATLAETRSHRHLAYLATRHVRIGSAVRYPSARTPA